MIITVENAENSNALLLHGPSETSGMGWVCVCGEVRSEEHAGRLKGLLEGKVSWRTVGEARERAGRLSDAAGHVQVVGVEQGGGHGQVSELGVKVPQVSGSSLGIR